jgi:hypothetical protein
LKVLGAEVLEFLVGEFLVFGGGLSQISQISQIGFLGWGSSWFWEVWDAGVGEF